MNQTIHPTGTTQMLTSLQPESLLSDSLSASGIRRARPWVLLCDKNPEVRARLVELLGDLGFAVWECARAEQAVAAARSAPRLSALLVNVKDGAEVADAVRRVQPDVRVLFLSGGRHDEDGWTDLEVVGRLLGGATRLRVGSDARRVDKARVR